MEPLRAGDPHQVGPYRLKGRLGGGGMGQVFLGRSRGGRPVAVKVVRPELADDAGFRRRFAIEVEAARRVGGFYTAQVVDADPDADPPWLVTAYVPGPSLHQAVAEHGPLRPAAIGVLGAGLAEGLAVIHDCDLVHRDLKPGNVILAADGPRVIDFGIARALDATSHTVSGAVVGTPAFMSPEQVQSDQVGPASDVFSLGAVLAFAATGRGPFGVGQGHAIMYRIVHDDPNLAGLPKDLADLVGACLAKTPEKRPSVTDLLDRLAEPGEGTTRWLPPEVTALITQLEQDLSESSGGGAVSGPVADSKHRSAVDHAVRIVCSIDDPEKQQEALYEVAVAIAEADLDHAEQHLQQLPSVEARALALLASVEELSDTARAQQLINHAERLIAQLLDDGSYSVEHETLEGLIDLLIAVDPQRALAVLDRATQRVVDFDNPELRAKALAAEAGRVAATAPARATGLMGQAVEVARTIPPNANYAFHLPQTLAEIAKVGYTADRRHAERLIDLAEATALGVRGDDQDWALKWTGVEVAEADPARAEQIISKITEAYIRASAWRDILEAAASTGQDHRPLLDAAERSVTEPVAQEPVAQEAVPVKPDPWWGRWQAKSTIGDDHQREENAGPWYLRYIATGAARCDPSRAEAIASRITDADDRCEAFAAMADQIAETNPLQARWWLNTAYQTALEAEPERVLSVMGKIAAAGAGVGPATAQQAAQYIADHADDTDLEAWLLVTVAEDVVAVDPELAVRLIDLAETRAQQPGQRRLDNHDLERIAETLMAVAMAWADSKPEQIRRILRHLLEAALAAQSTAYLSIAETGTPNLPVIEQFLREHHGPGRDHLLCIAASAFAATDAHRAEQLAQQITDDPLRYAALNVLATSIIKQAMGSAADPNTKHGT
ncbi:hypothetical protein GCM10023196_085950 [Actinoallomurus vinaceus]|uniref:Protein kinase domain-containing protein n=1 Tax=Actinoallomurus vinaceus TaxID=1080074 RepID=A0ABP8USX3_9ACTN